MATRRLCGSFLSSSAWTNWTQLSRTSRARTSRPQKIATRRRGLFTGGPPGSSRRRGRGRGPGAGRRAVSLIRSRMRDQRPVGDHGRTALGEERHRHTGQRDEAHDAAGDDEDLDARRRRTGRSRAACRTGRGRRARCGCRARRSGRRAAGRHHAGQAELLADGGEDEVGVGGEADEVGSSPGRGRCRGCRRSRRRTGPGRLLGDAAVWSAARAAGRARRATRSGRAARSVATPTAPAADISRPKTIQLVRSVATYSMTTNRPKNSSEVPRSVSKTRIRIEIAQMTRIGPRSRPRGRYRPMKRRLASASASRLTIR